MFVFFFAVLPAIMSEKGEWGHHLNDELMDDMHEGG